MGTRSTMDTVKLIGGLVLLSLVIVFTLQNTATIGVDFLFWQVDASGAIFVFLNFAIGVVVGWILRSRQHSGGIRLRGDRPEPED